MIALIVWVAGMCLAGWIGHRKGTASLGWGLGAIIGWLGAIIMACIPRRFAPVWQGWMARLAPDTRIWPPWATASSPAARFATGPTPPPSLPGRVVGTRSKWADRPTTSTPAGPPGPCRRAPAERRLGPALRHLGGAASQGVL
jgi:hypothetical protein